ncbi:MAG: flagellar protein FlgA [Proteobacteria bacterium]|nr:flagellar protein FlgA [Pseudomonadota bacterium]
MNKLLFALVIIGAGLGLGLASPARADPIRDTALRHAQTQSQGLPGEVAISVGNLDPQTQLPACTSLEAFTPPGARPWGHTHVGVRCLAPKAWNILVPVQITVTGNYVVTARALSAGQAIAANDLAVLRGDLAGLPVGVITEISKATGKTLKNSLAANQPLRADLLLAPILIRQGQVIKLRARGPNFTVTSEGKALNNASEGQVAQIKVASGQTVSGIVQADGSVEIAR